jgi:hypothetical protein
MKCSVTLSKHNFFILPSGAMEYMANWNETKERLRSKIVALTDNKVLIALEKRDDLISKLAVKLGKTREAIVKIIKDL